MPNPSAYIETTVIGHLAGRVLDDPIIGGRQRVTRLWWPIAVKEYELYVSSVVADECSAGNADASKERMEILNSLSFLAISPITDRLAADLIAKHAVPATEPRDALHIAISAVNGIEYLVSWNFKHIVNPKTRAAIERVCEEAGYSPPMICTPDELLES
jgi:predicted nucleic acid-binding protein